MRAALVLSALLGAGCRGEYTPTLSDLSSVGQFQARFNEDAGKTRVVLLLSPT